MRKRFLFSALAALVPAGLLACSVWALDEVTFKAFLEKDKIKLSDKIQYLIEIQFSTDTMIPSISPPSFAQFNVLAENEKIIEAGQGADRYRILRKIWLLEPAEAGRLSIASAIITYQDPTSNLLKNGKTDVAFVDVESSGEEGVPGHQPATPAVNTATAAGRAVSWPLVAVLAAVAAAGIAVWLLRRKPGGPKIAAEDQALLTLQQAITHAEQGDLGAYFAVLTRALLDYLQNKFQLDAHVLDTPSLLGALKGHPISAQAVDSLKEFFALADKAKFAGYVPDEEHLIRLHQTVKDFIEAGRRVRVKPAKPKPKQAEEV
jgi:hypothetical protein